MKKPEIMFGYDTSIWEVSNIVENKKIPLDTLINLGDDNFFLMEKEKFKIKEDEAKELDLFFKYKARKYEKEIKSKFRFIT